MYFLSFLFMFLDVPLGRGDSTDGTDYWSESYDLGKFIN